ncbi:endonuclease/exonuclease/phosphatase family protein [Streptosporangium lutulentum]|uniref:Endonuclease/exonuclease/phosphatase (EEP) superfamily protein YafD n=1 Tax=Streptosporangium lutulentum TaxID=1461250 RepID=A0ABT9Q6L9_9ACTN|nr:hypothetical protein [Streptosporangium lutulentum]MDP9842410.1 endonuclease/exonuclease/phosphatase (EEP) superfamily protein YafD [Streptosporangium lutulentum]
MRRSRPAPRALARLCLVILLAAVGSVVTAPAIPAAAAAAQEYRVLQLNLCHSGVNTSCYNGAAVIQEARDVITAKQPQAVTLNEICRADVAQLAPSMGNGYSMFAPAVRADGTPVRCTDGDEYGNGMIFRATGATGFSGVYGAQDSGSEKRVYVCAEFPDLTACATHLSTTGTVAMAQCKAAVSMLLGRGAATKPTFLAGDFNLRYAPLFGQNVQNCNSAPFFRKGDGDVQHVFAAGMGYTRTEVVSMRYTDHPGLLVVLTKP